MRLLANWKALILLATVAASALSIGVKAQSPATAPSAAGQTLADAAARSKFAFVVFYREDDAATRAMTQVVGDELAKRPDAAVSTFVQITNPAEQAVVERFAVGRAPMPLMVAVAPNGAVTGVGAQRVTAADVAGAFVTPGMAGCMKAMQDGKLVFLCLQNGPQPPDAAGVAEFLADPQFKDRTTVVVVQAAEPAEQQLLAELQISVAPGAANSVLFAPPGVLVGKFGAASTKDQIGAALHQAGKCCNDPNCKHARGNTTQK
jgi:hypothetical protein